MTIDLKIKSDTFVAKTESGVSITGSSGKLGFKDNESVSIISEFKDSKEKHSTIINKEAENSFTIKQIFKNSSNDGIAISDISMPLLEITLEGKGWQVIHSELFKKDVYCNGYGFFTGGLIEPLENVSGQFGLSEDFPFPGIFFSHPERGTFLIATLSQKKFKPLFEISRKREKISLSCKDAILGIPTIKVPANEEFCSEEWVILSIEGDFEDAVDEYFKLLKTRIDFKGTNSILRNSIVWGSWNYNTRERGFWDINHSWLVDMSKKFIEITPADKEKFIMIDDGYQQGRSEVKAGDDWYGFGIDIFYPEDGTPHDPKLFPEGMKAIADDIAATGAKPAIWITPRIRRSSDLARENPEWCLELKEGSDLHGRTAFLDYSVPEAREYTRKAWDTIFNKWGYKAVKVDFWSMAFELPEIVFKNTDMTAVELRNLFIKDISEFIPEDGYLLNCCATNAGNPFLGIHADATRSGMDIGKGAWKNIEQSGAFLSGVIPFYRHDCFISDADSVGWNKEITPGQNRLWATFAMFGGSMFELGGDLLSLDSEQEKFLKTFFDFAGPSINIKTDLAAGKLNNFPISHLTLERPDGFYEAYLNWYDVPREISVEDEVTDIWSGEKISGKYHIAGYDAIMFKRK